MATPFSPTSRTLAPKAAPPSYQWARRRSLSRVCHAKRSSLTRTLASGPRNVPSAVVTRRRAWYGVFGVTDHVGNDGANNAQLHRIPKHFLIEDAKAAGFVVEAESDMLAHPADDHTKVVFDPTLRGKTDQFVVRLRKPK